MSLERSRSCNVAMRYMSITDIANLLQFNDIYELFSIFLLDDFLFIYQDHLFDVLNGWKKMFMP